nr:unnamed protein product [Callosobruchus chinensis]
MTIRLRSGASIFFSGAIELTNRHWWAITTVLLVVAAAGVGVPLALKISSSASFEERVEFATRLLQEVPLIDGHNDLPWNIRKFLHNKLRNFKFNEDLRSVSPWSTSAWSHTDLVRLQRGHVAAQHQGEAEAVFPKWEILSRDKKERYLCVATIKRNYGGVPKGKSTLDGVAFVNRDAGECQSDGSHSRIFWLTLTTKGAALQELGSIFLLKRVQVDSFEDSFCTFNTCLEEISHLHPKTFC